MGFHLLKSVTSFPQWLPRETTYLKIDWNLLPIFILFESWLVPSAYLADVLHVLELSELGQGVVPKGLV